MRVATPGVVSAEAAAERWTGDPRVPRRRARTRRDRRATGHGARAGSGPARRAAATPAVRRRLDGAGRAGRLGIHLPGEHRPRRVEPALPQRTEDGARHRPDRGQPRPTAPQPVRSAVRGAGLANLGRVPASRRLPRSAVRRAVRRRWTPRGIHDGALPARRPPVAGPPARADSTRPSRRLRDRPRALTRRLDGGEAAQGEHCTIWSV